jgi:hypothetical protein
MYSYVVAALADGSIGDDAIAGMLAARVAEHAGRRALRIVDFLGPPEVFSRAGAVVQHLLREYNAEYADVYNAGLDPVVFERAGFVRIDPAGPHVVPDHFEPFERRNVTLRFAIRTAARPLFFKGDADQDRPSLLGTVPS